MYGDLLKQPLPDRVSTVAFTDDVTLVARIINELEYLGDDAIKVVPEWLSCYVLNLAVANGRASHGLCLLKCIDDRSLLCHCHNSANQFSGR